MATKIPNGRKIDQMTIKYTNIFHRKTLKKLLRLVVGYIFHVSVYCNEKNLAALGGDDTTRPRHCGAPGQTPFET
jgi:hypothetical protein